MKGRFAVLVVALLMLGIIPATAAAKKPDTPGGNPPTTQATVTGLTTVASTNATGKVALCHRTGSTTKPWVKIVVSGSARKAHEKHGDVLAGADGSCPTTTSTRTGTSTVSSTVSTTTTSATSATTTNP